MMKADDYTKAEAQLDFKDINPNILQKKICKAQQSQY